MSNRKLERKYKAVVYIHSQPESLKSPGKKTREIK